MNPELLPYLTPAELAALARSEAATPGPWDLCGGEGEHFVIGTPERGICVIPNEDNDGEVIRAVNASFIAAARSDLPAALETLAQARADAARYRTALEVIASNRAIRDESDWYRATSLINIAAGAL